MLKYQPFEDKNGWMGLRIRISTYTYRENGEKNKHIRNMFVNKIFQTVFVKQNIQIV